MKPMRIASTVLFFLLFAAFAYASPQEQEEPKPKEASPAMKHPEAKPEAKPETQEQKPDEMKAEKNERDKKDNKDATEQEKQGSKEEKKSGKEMGNENKAHGHPAGKGSHIPDDKFRSSFGKSHTFHPSRPTVVNGQPTLVFGGYSFIMVDPWPAEWAYTDDCYIDYIDGDYFLFDLLHPGVRIALFVAE